MLVVLGVQNAEDSCLTCSNVSNSTTSDVHIVQRILTPQNQSASLATVVTFQSQLSLSLLTRVSGITLNILLEGSLS